jgi:hypothetical protein
MQNSSDQLNASSLQAAMASLQKLLNEERHLVFTFQGVTVPTLASPATSLAELAAVLHEVRFVATVSYWHIGLLSRYHRCHDWRSKSQF